MAGKTQNLPPKQVTDRHAILRVINVYRDLIMTLTDAILVLLLAETIHGTDEAIRKSAKNMAKRLPRSKRSIMYDIAEGKSPRELMRRIALGLDEEENEISTHSREI